jgi:hypothetical protein
LTRSSTRESERRVRRIIMRVDTSGCPTVVSDETAHPITVAALAGVETHRMCELDDTPTLPVTELVTRSQHTFFPPTTGVRARCQNRAAQNSVAVVRDPNHYDADCVLLDGITYRIDTDDFIRAADLSSGDAQVADSLSRRTYPSCAARTRRGSRRK